MGGEPRESLPSFEGMTHLAQILTLPNFSKSFELEYDAFSIGIGVAILQEGNPVAYFSKTLKGTQLNYSTYDQDLYALMRVIQTWQHYLLPKEFVIHSDHEALKHLRGQGKMNVVDALLRRHVLIAMLETKMLGLDCIKELYEKDLDFRKKLCINELHLEAHEGGLLGHFGELKTLVSLSEHFYWPHMRNDVHNICKRCLTCKLAKSRVSPHGLYTLLLILTSP
ncbi:Retrovirus-related Pol polyprotein, partial [Mucuna pruriens]